MQFTKKINIFQGPMQTTVNLIFRYLTINKVEDFEEGGREKERERLFKKKGAPLKGRERVGWKSLGKAVDGEPVVMKSALRLERFNKNVLLINRVI